MSDLPVGWAAAELGDCLLSVVGGGTPSRNVPAYFEGSIPWFTVKDMKSLKPSDAEEHISEAAAADSATNLIPPNTLICATRIALGRAMRPTVRCAINQDLKALFVGDGVDPDFLLYWIAASERVIQDKGSGTTVSGIRLETLKSFPLHLPPSSEQSRIVEKLEELLSGLDAGVVELKAAQRKLAQYRQSLLKAAMEGALTADWRAAHGKPQETGAQLLQRILTERQTRWEQKQLIKFAEQGKAPPKGWQDKYPEPVVPDLNDLPQLPEGWVWATMDQCAIGENGITDGPFGSNLKSEHYTDSGPRVIRLQNIGDGRFLDALAHISEERYERLKKHAVMEGDVVVAMLGEVLPRSCVVPAGIAPAIVKADCARIRLNSEIIPPALAVAVLNAEPTRKRVNGLVKGIGRPRVNLGNIRSIPVPLPPRAEQQQILSVLSQSLESCDTESLAIERGFYLSAAQRRSLLKAAFAGQLVPQDPSEEPASVLLARIRVEREKQARQPKARKTKQHKEVAAVLSKLIDVLTETGDWMPAQEAFRRCGVVDGAQTDQIEALYAELRALDKAGRLAIEPVKDQQGRKLFDKLKLIAG